MLYVPHPNKYNFIVDNWSTTGAIGSAATTSLTPGASNVWGAWTEMISDTVITSDCYLMEIIIAGTNTNNNDKSQLFDIGIDAAGGTSYVSMLGDTGTVGQAATKGILCGNSQALFSGAASQIYILPLRIPASAALAVRIQGSNSSAGTARCGVRLYGKPSRPEMVYSGQAIEIVGTISGSGGVSFTPGTTAWGSWQSLGTTTRACRWWQLATQLADGSMQALNYYWELAVGDGSSYNIILRDSGFTTTGEIHAYQMMSGSHNMAYCPVPAGATMYVRSYASAAPDTTWSAVAVGVT